MTSILLNAYLKIGPSDLINQFIHKVFKAATDTKMPDAPTVEPADIKHCKCCNWKGKSSETTKKHLLLSDDVELEMFCPKCQRYIGFTRYQH